jgi:hypothetical protein
VCDVADPPARIVGDQQERLSVIREECEVRHGAAR